MVGNVLGVAGLKTPASGPYGNQLSIIYLAGSPSAVVLAASHRREEEEETMATTTATSPLEKAEPEGTRPEHLQQQHQRHRSLDQELFLFSQQQQQDPPGRRLPVDYVVDKDASDQSTVSSVSTRHFYYAELCSGRLYPSLPLDEDKEGPCTDNDFIHVDASEDIDGMSDVSDYDYDQELREVKGQKEHQVSDGILTGSSRQPLLSAEAGENRGGKETAERRRPEADRAVKQSSFSSFTDYIDSAIVSLEQRRQQPVQALRRCTREQEVKKEVLEKPTSNAGRAGSQDHQEESESRIIAAARAKHIEVDVTALATTPPIVVPGAVAVGPEDLRQSSRQQEHRKTNNFQPEQGIPIIPVAFTVNDDTNDGSQMQLEELRGQLEQKDLHVKTLEQELAILRGKLRSAAIAKPGIVNQSEAHHMDKINSITQ